MSDTTTSLYIEEGHFNKPAPDQAIRFSVVVATYNRRDYVLKTVQSVVEQTYPAWEIIVVIDGSQDCTAEALRDDYPQVIVVQQPNLGRSVARNTGIANATGDWVCFIDDDDLWHKDKLSVTADYIARHPDCEAITNPVWFFSDTPDGPAKAFGFSRDFVAATLEECHQAVAAGDPSGNDAAYLDIQGNSFRLLLENNRGVLSATVVKRDVLIRAGCFCPMQAYGEDWTAFVNVARLCEWHTLPQRLGFTRLHHSQSTNDSYNALITLTGQVNAWYTGRPLPAKVTALDFIKELKKYGPTYRMAVQGYFWGALRSGQFPLAHLIHLQGKMLLPRYRDYLYSLLPPPLTWRWEHHVLGMHK